MFSEPILIGQVVTDEDGNFSQSLNLPAGLKAGFHTLQLGSLTADGKEITASVAMELQGKDNSRAFKGFVAVYAKGFAGQRLSAKIGKDWVIVPSLASNFVRVTDFTGAGVNISVRIFIDRVLVGTFPLVTR